ncbi:MAG: hypothetical protein AAF184_09805 [Pseudomonadota bacterium]
MPPFVSEFLKLLYGVERLWAIPLSAFPVLWVLHWMVLGEDRVEKAHKLKWVAERPDPRKSNSVLRLKSSLEKRAFGEKYRVLVGVFLDWSARVLPPTYERSYTDPKAELWDSCFNNSALAFFVAISIAYPIILMTTDWAVGGSGALGSIQVYSDNLGGWGKMVTLVGLFVMWPITLVLVVSDALLAEWPVTPRRLAKGLLLAGALAFALAFAGRVAGAGVVAFAGVLAGALAVFVAGIFANAVFGPVVRFVPGTGAVAATLAVGLAVGLAVLGAVNSVVNGVVVGVVTVVVAVGAFAGAGHVVETKWRRLLPAILGCVFLVPTLVAAAALEVDVESAANLWPFLVVLPFCNAVFDFASFGVTRLLLTRSIASSSQGGRSAWLRVIGYSALDSLVAAVTLGLLAISIVGLSQLLNIATTIGPTGAPVIDLESKFAGLRSQSQWWVSAMHFSTFVPTLLHLSVMAYAAGITLIPAKWNDWAVERLQPGTPMQDSWRFWIATLQTIRWWFPFMLVYVLMIGLFSFGQNGGLSTVGNFYLSIAECFSDAIGATEGVCTAGWLGGSVGG